MRNRNRVMPAVGLSLVTGVAHAYRAATCEQLGEQNGQPKSEDEQRVIEFPRSDPKVRTIFINKVAGTIVNRMFDCGMLP